MTCDEARASIGLFLYDELPFHDEEAFEAHLAACEACRAELAHDKGLLHAISSVVEDVPPELLRTCRTELSARIGGEKQRPARFWERLVEQLSIQIHVPSLRQPIGALMLIAMGFFGGRLLPHEQTAGLSASAIFDSGASRVRNVDLGNGGRIQVVVEETLQKTLTGDIDNPSIQRLLLIAAKDASDPGLRLESIDLLRPRSEIEDVRQALLVALQQDPNAGVRLKALEGLKGSAAQPDVRRILARVLLSDENPGVRTQVIDLLIQQRQEPQTVGLLQELMGKEDNGYVRMRCQKALRDSKASLETF